MDLAYHKIEKISGVCRKRNNANCKMERRWNKKHLKRCVSRARIKEYETKIIKEMLKDVD